MQAERIVGIKYLGKIKTINITVDSPSHLYYHNGICGQNSHATQYAIHSAKLGFLKSHWPIHFYTAALKSPRKSTTETDIANLIYDAKNFNIKTKLPNLKHLRPEFYNDGKSIYFGLQNIRNFGESAFRSLVEVVDKDRQTFLGVEGGEASFFEFAINSARYLSPSNVSLLIESGAVDWFGLPRSLMLDEFNLIAGLTVTEKDKLFKFYDAQKAGVSFDKV